MGVNYNPFSLEGKTILVTGASSGIGRATAIECSKLGASLVITARNENRLRETMEQLNGDNHQMIICDLSDMDCVSNLIEKLPELDGIVNNAGMNKMLPIQFVSKMDFIETMQVNAISPIMLTQGLLKKKKIFKGGSIVFVSSIAGHTRSTIGNTMYCASKGTITGFVKCLAKELAAKKIRCNEVLPGQSDTGIMSQGVVSDEQMRAMETRIPMRRLGMPIEIANGIVFLLSDASSYVTGSSLIIDGGQSL
jgi:NAD(P)-dependent dehydrogenase (short-subunit alcohol dehydrogenase family)